MRLLTCVAVTACGASSAGGDSPVAPSSTPVVSHVELSVTPDTIQVGQTATARADYYDQYGGHIAPGSVTWAAAPAGIVTVSTDGAVTGLAPGMATVSATAGGKSAFWNITVRPLPVATVTLTPKTMTLDIGLSRQLSVALNDAAGHALTDDRTVYWSSSDTTRVSVSPDGRVTAIAAGTASITATSEGIVDSALITVTNVVSPVAHVALLPAAVSIATGRSVQLSTLLTNAAGDTLSGRTATWSSNAPDIAQVSADGVVTALSVGAAVISASVEGQSATASIVVNDDVIVNIAQPDSVAIFGDTLPVIATVTAKDSAVSVSATVVGAPPGYAGLPLVLTPIYNAAGGFAGYDWTARLPIRNLATGSYRLLVTATDARGTQGSAVAVFKHEAPGAGGVKAPKMK